MKPKLGYIGYICSRCGHIAKKYYSWFKCTNPNCECQSAYWAEVE